MKSKKGDEYTAPVKERQGELFTEYEKLRTKRPGHIFRQDIALGKKISFQISYENFILFFIVLIMLFVVFFSLGVERGKKVNVGGERIMAGAEAGAGQTAGEPVKKEEAPMAEKEKEMPAEKKPIAALAKPYTIQVIAFKKGQELRAEKELDRLKKDGYEAFTISSGEWIQICAGRYSSKEDTKKDCDSLRARYPTCYVRKVNN